MKNVSRTACQLSLSVIFVLVLAFNSSARQNDDKGRETGSSNPILATEQIRDEPQRESKEARAREEKALEQMDKARHRNEAESEESRPPGLEKKQEREQKEVDKGSEQGQKMREEHSRKWWKFWE